MSDLLEQQVNLKAVIGAIATTLFIAIAVAAFVRSYDHEALTAKITAEVKEEYRQAEYQSMKSQLSRIESDVKVVSSNLNQLTLDVGQLKQFHR